MTVFYILALNQGTTSSRSILFNEKVAFISTAQKEFIQTSLIVDA